jgi:hypothetical protein
MVKKAAKYQLKLLHIRYPKQLPTSAIQRCMSCVPADIALIAEEDLQRLENVDQVMDGCLWRAF